MTVLFRDMTSESKGNGTIRTDVKVYPYCHSDYPTSDHPIIYQSVIIGTQFEHIVFVILYRGSYGNET